MGNPCWDSLGSTRWSSILHGINDYFNGSQIRRTTSWQWCLRKEMLRTNQDSWWQKWNGIWISCPTIVMENDSGLATSEIPVEKGIYTRNKEPWGWGVLLLKNITTIVIVYLKKFELLHVQNFVLNQQWVDDLWVGLSYAGRSSWKGGCHDALLGRVSMWAWPSRATWNFVNHSPKRQVEVEIQCIGEGFCWQGPSLRNAACVLPYSS